MLSMPDLFVRTTEETRRAFRVACAEDGLTYGEFIERALAERREKLDAMRHPLDRSAVRA